MGTTFTVNRSRQTAGRDRTRRPAFDARRQRLSAFETAVLIAVVALLVVGIVTVRSPRSLNTDSRVLQVNAGDTLWSIARANPVPGLSTAQTAELIASSNGLPTAALAEGQVLLVPARAAQDAAVASR